MTNRPLIFLQQQDANYFSERFKGNIRKVKDKTKNPLSQRYLDIMKEYLKEAITCNNYKAYNAATMLISSAIEAALLAIAYTDNRFLKAYIKTPKKKRKNINRMTLPELIEICKNGEIPPFDNITDQKLSDIIKNIRNLIHPGRRIATNICKIDQFEFILLKDFLENIQRANSLY